MQEQLRDTSNCEIKEGGGEKEVGRVNTFPQEFGDKGNT